MKNIDDYKNKINILKTNFEKCLSPILKSKLKKNKPKKTLNMNLCIKKYYNYDIELNNFEDSNDSDDSDDSKYNLIIELSDNNLNKKINT